MRRGPDLKQRGRVPREREEPALPPVPTGIALGLWVAAMLLLAVVVVPAAFGSCTATPLVP